MEGLRGRKEGRRTEPPAARSPAGHLRPPSRAPEPPASAGARSARDGGGQSRLRGTAGARERETSREHFKRKNKMESSENAPALPAPLGVTARPGDEEKRDPFPGAEGTPRTPVPPRQVESFPPEL